MKGTIREEVTIRETKKKERNEVREIQHKVLYPELTALQNKEWNEGEGVFSPQSFVVLLSGEIVGFSVFEIYEVKANEIIITLDAIAIKKDFQNQGIGKILLKEATEKAKNYWDGKGFRARGLIIETGTDEAGNFYEKVFPSFQKKVIEKTWIDEEGIIIYFVPLS